MYNCSHCGRSSFAHQDGTFRTPVFILAHDQSLVHLAPYRYNSNNHRFLGYICLCCGTPVIDCGHDIKTDDDFIALDRLSLYERSQQELRYAEYLDDIANSDSL